MERAAGQNRHFPGAPEKLRGIRVHLDRLAGGAVQPAYVAALQRCGKQSLQPDDFGLTGVERGLGVRSVAVQFQKGIHVKKAARGAARSAPETEEQQAAQRGEE